MSETHQGYTLTSPQDQCADQYIRQIKLDIHKRTGSVRQLERRIAKSLEQIQKLEALIVVDRATLPAEQEVLGSLKESLAVFERNKK